MTHVSRRGFLGVAGGTAAGLGAAGGENGSAAFPELMQDMTALVQRIPLVDTHEHIIEEAVRVAGKDEPRAGIPAPDFGMLMMHYTDSDLRVSGMPREDVEALTSHDLPPRKKWKLVAPYYERCRHTGYQMCVRETIRALYGEDDLREDNCEKISEKLHDRIAPGYYRDILNKVANIEYCHVNSLETSIFMETAQPDLLAQDISTVALSSGLDIPRVQKTLNREAGDLDQYHALIDDVFAKYGPRAIAVKNQSAYSRRLDYAEVDAATAAPLYARLIADPASLAPEEKKALQDHLFHYCVERATEHNLPVKLHTGYYAGDGGMPLERVRQNAGDLCPVIKAHPKTKFMLMHIDYPYQDEVIALAKHYGNVYVDMCWAWIINPLASVRFMKEFLMAAPASKLFTFGGDYRPAELSVGHAAVARKGIAQALAELVAEGWVAESEITALAERVMNSNAHECYDQKRALQNWKK